MIQVLLLLVVVVLSACNSEKSSSGIQVSEQAPAVIYGQDSRQDVASMGSKGVEALAKISVALVEKTNIKAMPDGTVEILGKTLQEQTNFCPTEPFIKQRSGAFCSGVLFRGKYVLTAGHCMDKPESCSTTAFVFGFQVPRGNPNWNYRIPARNVFSCKRIVAKHFLQSNGGGPETLLRSDFAIIELDRQVANQGAIPVIDGNIPLRTPVHVLGYPSGVPLKYADGIVLDNKPGSSYFRTNLDTYGGNSGSPVFNSQGALAGLLIQGHQDYARTPAGCIASVKCISGGNFCLGERVIKADLIRRFLKINEF